MIHCFSIIYSGTVCTLSNKNKVINEVKGSWLEYLEFDAKKYWDISLFDPA